MSGYGYPSFYSQQSENSAQTTAHPAVPQYTQTQLNQYFARYHFYPPQPYQIVSELYPQPVAPPVIRSLPQAIPQPITILRDTYQQNFNVPLDYEDPAIQWPARSIAHEVPQSPAQYHPQDQIQNPTTGSSRTKTWTCDVAHCTSSAHFTRLADLQRHQATVHGMGTPEYPCTIPHCSRVGDKGFTRRDHLMEHLRNFHKIDVPKRKAGERSAFPYGWPEDIRGEGSWRKSE